MTAATEATGDVTKLPKWAQRRIEVLEMRLREANATLTQGPENSNTFADPYMDEKARPLGTDTLVRFVIEPDTEDRVGKYIDVRLSRDHARRNYLSVRGSDSYVIVPESSNLARVRIER